jgi:hypothetical protein
MDTRSRDKYVLLLRIRTRVALKGFVVVYVDCDYLLGC